MRKYLVPFILALALALPAAAGEHKKCDKPLQECLNSMVSELKSTGFIGVEIEGVCDKCKKGEKAKNIDGYRVTRVIKGTPAETAGIQVGDILYGINGIKFNKKNDEKLSKVKVPGKKVTCNMKRNGVDKDIKLTLVPMPADIMAKYIGEYMLMHAEQDKDTVAEKP